LSFTPVIIPVCLDFRRMIRDVQIKPRHLFTLTPRQFEEFVAEIWRNLGYETELTAKTRDNGRDVIAVKKAEVNLRFIIECKRYSSSNRVGARLVRELYGVTMHEKANKGILATTSTFTNPARAFFDAHPWELEARDFDGVVEWVKLATKD
jgi:restriction system protein